MMSYPANNLMLQQRFHNIYISESWENVCKLHCINGFQESYASVATTLSESHGNVAYLRCCNVIHEHCSNVEQQL